MIKWFKTVVTNYGFDWFKKFKTVIGDYGFLTWTPTWHRRTRLGIIFKIGLLYRFFFLKCCILGQNSRYFRVVLWIVTTMSFVRGSWRLLRGDKYLHEEAMEIEFDAWIKKDLKLLMVESSPCIIKKR